MIAPPRYDEEPQKERQELQLIQSLKELQMKKKQ